MFPWNVNTKRKYEGKKNTLRNEAHKETFNTHYFVVKKKKASKASNSCSFKNATEDLKSAD